MLRRCLLFWVLLLAAGVTQAQVLRMGFGTDKPPYVFEKRGRGLEVDIVREAASRGGFGVMPFFAPMERLHAMLAAGHIDAIVTTSPATGIAAFYSQPYIEYHNFAVALASRQLDIQGISDLGRYSVSSFQYARKLLGEEFEAMAKNNPAYREEPYQITRDRLLYGGRVDVVVGDRRIFEYFRERVADSVDVHQKLIWYPIFPSTPYCVAFRDEATRDRFDAGLKSLRNSSDYAAIEKRYAKNPGNNAKALPAPRTKPGRRGGGDLAGLAAMTRPPSEIQPRFTGT